MTYNEFLEKIDDYVNCVVEFTAVIKATGKTHKCQRVVWDNKTFSGSKDNSNIEIINVDFIRRCKFERATGITKAY